MKHNHNHPPMPRFITTITQQTQLTIPADIHHTLSINPGDKVTFTVHDDRRVTIAPTEFTLETA